MVNVPCLEFATKASSAVHFVFGTVICFTGIFVSLELNQSELKKSFVPTMYTYFGVLLCMLSIVGIIATSIKNPKMVFIYAIVLTVVSILQLAVYIFAYTQRSKIRHLWRDDLDQSFKTYEKNKLAAERVDLIQSTFHCCGYYAPQDFTPTLPPVSCCIHKEDDESDQCENLTKFYTYGCGRRVLRYFQGRMFIVINFCITCAVTSIITAVLAFLLWKQYLAHGVDDK